MSSRKQCELRKNDSRGKKIWKIYTFSTNCQTFKDSSLYAKALKCKFYVYFQPDCVVLWS